MGRKDTRKYKYFALQTLDPEGKPVIEKMKVENCHNRCLESSIDAVIRDAALGNRERLKYRAVTGEVVRLEITLWEISEEEYQVKEAV